MCAYMTVHNYAMNSLSDSHLADSNFIVRMLFYEAYSQHSVYLCVICATFITISLLQLRFVTARSTEAVRTSSKSQRQNCTNDSD